MENSENAKTSKNAKDETTEEQHASVTPSNTPSEQQHGSSSSVPVLNTETSEDRSSKPRQMSSRKLQRRDPIGNLKTNVSKQTSMGESVVDILNSCKISKIPDKMDASTSDNRKKIDKSSRSNSKSEVPTYRTETSIKNDPRKGVKTGEDIVFSVMDEIKRVLKRLRLLEPRVPIEPKSFRSSIEEQLFISSQSRKVGKSKSYSFNSQIKSNATSPENSSVRTSKYELTTGKSSLHLEDVARKHLKETCVSHSIPHTSTGTENGGHSFSNVVSTELPTGETGPEHKSNEPKRKGNDEFSVENTICLRDLAKREAERVLEIHLERISIPPEFEAAILPVSKCILDAIIVSMTEIAEKTARFNFLPDLTNQHLYSHSNGTLQESGKIIEMQSPGATAVTYGVLKEPTSEGACGIGFVRVHPRMVRHLREASMKVGYSIYNSTELKGVLSEFRNDCWKISQESQEFILSLENFRGCLKNLAKSFSNVKVFEDLDEKILSLLNSCHVLIQRMELFVNKQIDPDRFSCLKWCIPHHYYDLINRYFDIRILLHSLKHIFSGEMDKTGDKKYENAINETDKMVENVEMSLHFFL